MTTPIYTMFGIQIMRHCQIWREKKET